MEQKHMTASEILLRQQKALIAWDDALTDDDAWFLPNSANNDINVKKRKGITMATETAWNTDHVEVFETPERSKLDDVMDRIIDDL